MSTFESIIDNHKKELYEKHHKKDGYQNRIGR
jgi:hypothetical protein